MRSRLEKELAGGCDQFCRYLGLPIGSYPSGCNMSMKPRKVDTLLIPCIPRLSVAYWMFRMHQRDCTSLTALLLPEHINLGCSSPDVFTCCVFTIVHVWNVHESNCQTKSQCIMCAWGSTFMGFPVVKARGLSFWFILILCLYRGACDNIMCRDFQLLIRWSGVTESIMTQATIQVRSRRLN